MNQPTYHEPPSRAGMPTFDGDPSDAAPLRWGIMGCANIARKNARAMRLAKSATLVAVASRDLQKCKDWVMKYSCLPEGSVHCYGSYEELLSDRQVDAIYIPLPTAFHASWVPKVAAVGKHILIEKPVGLNLTEVRHMIDVCMQHGVLLMDGVMFMHNQRLRKIMAELHDPGKFFGEPLRITSGFSFKAPDDFLQANIRVKPDADPLGCLGDLGWYCIRFALCCYGYRWPTTARCVNVACNDADVPLDMTAEVRWATGTGNDKGEGVLHFHCSFLHPFRQWMEVVGTDRVLNVSDFVISKAEDAQFSIEQCQFPIDYDCSTIEAKRTYSTFDCVQEAHMFDNFARDIRALGVSQANSAGRLSFWAHVMAVTQASLDAIMKSSKNGCKEVPVQALSLSHPKDQ